MRSGDADVHVPDINDYLRAPRERVRSMPLGLKHPVELTHIAEVRLDKSWTIEPEHTTVSDPAFDFERQVGAEGHSLTLTDRFVSKADHVGPADASRYLSNLQRARDATNYSIYAPVGAADDEAPARPTSLAERINWPIAMVAALLLAGYGVLATRLYRYDPPGPHPAAPHDFQGQSIGGWLVLAGISFVLAPLRVGYLLAKQLPSYGLDTWGPLTTVGSTSYHALWAPVLLFELAANLALLVFALLLVVLFFQRRRSVPAVYIGVAAASIAVQLIDLLLSAGIPAVVKAGGGDWAALARSVVAFAIWVPYFRLSERVQATFVRRRRGSTAMSPVAG